jgi:trimeric autotransporter adhesin
MKKIFVLIILLNALFVSAQNVGIGTSTPQNKLHVAGGFRLDTLTGVGGAGLVWHNPNGVVYGIKLTGNTNDVLRGDGTFGTYNVNGNIGWLLSGNSGTNPASNFIGTTDDQPLLFRVNNIRHGYLGKSIFLGSKAGELNTAASNIGIGSGALGKNITGIRIVGVGDSALYNNTANSNTAVGNRSLYTNTIGQFNTALGNEALSKNSLGNNNTAVGNNALLKNTGDANNNGSNNTAIGSGALSSNTLGLNNTATGFDAMSSGQFAYESAAFGVSSLKNNNAPYNNAVGNYALFSNTSGAQNSAFGFQTMAVNTTGNNNSGFGFLTLRQNNGSENTAMGYKALEGNSEGQFNTAIGSQALPVNTKSWNNTAVGALALYSNNDEFADNHVAIGSSSLYNNTTGIGNVAIGQAALFNNLSGSNNVAIGRRAGILLPDNVSNVTVIGYETGWNTTLSNQVNIGNKSVTWIGGQVQWATYSDKRMKHDIKEEVPGLAFITLLKPVTYYINIRQQEQIANAGKKITPDRNKAEEDWQGKYDVEKIKMTGFLAQDVEYAAKSINYSFNGVHNPKNGGLYSLEYSAFVVPLVKAVQEQQSIIDKQQKLIDELLKRVTALEKK